MPHRSLNTARMEAVAEGAAQAEREPGEGRSEDRGREAPRTSFRDRRFAPAVVSLEKKATKKKRQQKKKHVFLIVLKIKATKKKKSRDRPG